MTAGSGKGEAGSDLGVAELDQLPEDQLASALAACCGARRWVERMMAARPFRDRKTLLSKADEAWWSLGADDWREAFAHHPRIGERDAKVTQEARARAWSASEQRGVAGASGELRAAIAEGNAEYERRFGHIYIVSAAGKSPEELLDLLSTRLMNDPITELQVAAAEQAKITRSRLTKLLTGGWRRVEGGV